MSLADEARALARAMGPSCPVATLDTEVRSEIQECYDLGLPGTAIAQALNDRGLTRPGDKRWTDEAIQRHRNGKCACESR